MKRTKIIYEQGDRFVTHLGIGHYQVFENGVTHASMIATIHYSGDEEKALMLAKKYANKELGMDNIIGLPHAKNWGEEYTKGYLQCLYDFAHWKDGSMMVGSTGKYYKDIVNQIYNAQHAPELEQCDTCGDYHKVDSVPRSCETGDGE